MQDIHALQSGSRFGGDFIILRPIGAGGMASVFEAREEPLGRIVALKVLSAGTGDILKRRFLSEARTMASMHHPNIAEVRRFGTDESTGLPFLAMERFPGSLADSLADSRTLPEADAARIALALADALAALHSHSPPLVHRDVKPSNVLLADDGRPVLADFGLAKSLSPDATALTSPSAGQPGTWLYASPEQRAGAPPSPAMDWYAFGVLLFRCLSGGFPGPGGELPRDTAAEVSRAWRPLLRDLLRDNPVERLCDPAAIRRALRRIARSCRRQSWLRRNRAALAAAAIAAAAIAAAIAAAALAAGALTGTRGAVRTGGVVPPGTSASPAAPKEAPAAPKATPVATKATAAPTSRFPAKDWARHYAERVRETLAAAIENPSPDAGNRIVVPKGSILLSGDIPASSSPPDIVLDGGKLLFSPPSRELRQVIDRCERFIAAAPGDTEEVPSNIVPKRTEWFASRILVMSRGGSAADADADIRAYVTNDVRRAPGTEAATLDVAGFSSIVLERRLLDPGLTITGYGSVADFLPSGLLRNRRWFDTDDPL